MSKPWIPTPAKVLPLIRQIEAATVDFAAREGKLEQEQRSARHRLNRQQHEALSSLRGSAEARITALEAATEARREAVHKLHDQRKSRITRVGGVLTRTLPKRAKEKRGAWLAKLQLKQLAIERTKTAGLENADAECVKFQERLTRRKSEFVALEHHAAKLFAGYGAFFHILETERNDPGTMSTGRHPELHKDLVEHIRVADESLNAFQSQPLPRLFRLVPLAVVVPLLLAAMAAAAFLLKDSSARLLAVAGGVVFTVILLMLYFVGRSKAAPLAKKIAKALGDARRTHRAAMHSAEAYFAGERSRIESDYLEAHKEISGRWSYADLIEREFEAAEKTELEIQIPRALETNERQRCAKLMQIQAKHAVEKETLLTTHAAAENGLTENHAAANAAFAQQCEEALALLREGWLRVCNPLIGELEQVRHGMAEMFPPWMSEWMENWRSPALTQSAAPVGSLFLDVRALTPESTQLPLPASPIAAPVALELNTAGSVLLETMGSSASAANFLCALVLRLLAGSEPGRLAFTFLDPVGLGKNFAAFMHLADFEEMLINRRIWTQRDQVEERLLELNEHIEKVIQMYLRDEYATIVDYNAQAGSIAEKHHFLVVADFPSGFSDTALQRLQNIAASGSRCGVHLLIHRDIRQVAADDAALAAIQTGCVVLRETPQGWTFGEAQGSAKLTLEAPPCAEWMSTLLQRIGAASVDSNRVQVPFSHIAPPPDALWTCDSSVELRVAIGRTGATKQQMLAIGRGTRQHALFAGKTGSGKSTLFHVIITNLALSHSPDEVEFYLIDFKKGVEFKCYATGRLPHARVVAIESDREFALSVLQRVDEELKRRGDLFRQVGAQDVTAYRRSGQRGPMPRSLLIIDEFQEFFTEDDDIAAQASVLFDRIVRQGRAFGIHVLLGTQTLGGAYTLARATLGQMAIRVALQCNEADAHLIMDENNAAPRLLSRPGEGIYNDAAGALEGNSPFQVVWLGDEERASYLDQIRKLAEQRSIQAAKPVVFEGNAPAAIQGNEVLADAMAQCPEKMPMSPRCWLGAPNAIKGPTAAVFHRQNGNHLLIVGQRDDAARALLAVSLLSLAAQYPAGTACIYLLHQSPLDSAEARDFERVVAACPHATSVAHGHDVDGMLAKIAQELAARIEVPAARSPAIFLLIHGLHRFKKLRPEDDFSFSSSGDAAPSAAARFATLISEGAPHGIHLLVTVDTFNNVSRVLSRKALTEFEMRVVFQMSANDSASVIESPRAASLGLHKALFYHEQHGSLEAFRPYAMPDAEWLERAAQALARRGLP